MSQVAESPSLPNPNEHEAPIPLTDVQTHLADKHDVKVEIIGDGTKAEEGVETSNNCGEGFSALSVNDKLKMAVMAPLSLFCMFFIVYGILAGHAALPGHPVILLLAFFAVVWVLGMAEGLQIALLEVDAEEMETVRFFWPGAYRCFDHTKGQGMSDWLAGRQVLVILSVFVVAQLTTFPTLTNFPFTDSPIPDWFRSAVINTGLPGALVVVAIGQLGPQLIATSHPLRLLCAWGAWAIVHAALLLQRVGVTHFAWLLTVGLDRLLRRGSDAHANSTSAADGTSKGSEQTQGQAHDQSKNEDTHCRSASLEAGGWATFKYVVMTLISLACFVIIMTGLAGGYSRFPGPRGLHFVVFFVVVAMLGYLEGLQVALLRFAVVYDPEKFKTTMPGVYKQYKLTEGSAKMNDFLCGRQVCVILCVFLVAQLSTFADLDTLPLIGTVPMWFRVAVFDTGLPGALIVVAVGQLVPQLIGEIHPLALMRAPGAVFTVQSAIALQRIGLTHFAVLVGLLTKALLNLDAKNASAHTHTHSNADDERQLAANAHHGQHRGLRHGGRYTRLVAEAQRRDMARFAEQFLACYLDGTVAAEGASMLPLPKGTESLFAGAHSTHENRSEFPRAETIASIYREKYGSVPRFLLPEEHAQHIPPYVVAHELLNRLHAVAQGQRTHERSGSQ